MTSFLPGMLARVEPRRAGFIHGQYEKEINIEPNIIVIIINYSICGYVIVLCNNKIMEIYHKNLKKIIE